MTSKACQALSVTGEIRVPGAISCIFFEKRSKFREMVIRGVRIFFTAVWATVHDGAKAHTSNPSYMPPPTMPAVATPSEHYCMRAHPSSAVPLAASSRCRCPQNGSSHTCARTRQNRDFSRNRDTCIAHMLAYARVRERHPRLHTHG